jgi:hypothetical protein
MTSTRPTSVTTDTGDTERVTDRSPDGQCIHTDAGTTWEAVEGRPGEWWEPDTERTARSNQ